MDVVEKSVHEAIRAQKILVSSIKKYRFEDFELSQCQDFVNVIKDIQLAEGQSKEMLDLFQQSTLTNFEVLCKLSRTISAADTQYLEWQQTPIVLEMLYKLDSGFRNAVEKFAQVIDESEDIISLEAMRFHTG